MVDKEVYSEEEKTEDVIEQNSEQTENEEEVNETGSEKVEEEEKVEASESSETEKYKQETLEYRDKLIRKIAEFENYKKRTSEEYVRLIETANEDLILKILPVVDDIERFSKNYNADHNADDLKKGVDMIFNKLQSTLKNLGLEEINVIDQEFDPNLHEALLQMEVPGKEPQTIVDQHEKGYTLKGKVIRHSKVIVAK